MSINKIKPLESSPYAAAVRGPMRPGGATGGHDERQCTMRLVCCFMCNLQLRLYAGDDDDSIINEAQDRKEDGGIWKVHWADWDLCLGRWSTTTTLRGRSGW